MPAPTAPTPLPAAAADLVGSDAAWFEFRALSEARNYRGRLIDEFGVHLGGDVLEVGAGIGQVTEEICAHPAVRTATALEPDRKFASAFRQRLPKTSLIEGTTADLPAGSAFDAIVCINVLEHIEHDRAELQRHAELLRVRGGHLCLLVPARPEIYAPIDRDFGHWRRYTRPELREKLITAGFDVVRLRYFNCAGYLAWWWTFRVRQQRHFGIRQVQIFDRWIFPWINAFERRITAPPIGQSLLAIARARS